MKYKSIRKLLSAAALTVFASPQAFAAETGKSAEKTANDETATEFLWKLSEPDTGRMAFGLSYGGSFRAFAYLDLQDVPASARGAEKQFHVPAYALGITARNRPVGNEMPTPDSANLRAYSDILVRYSEASAALGRDGFWTVALQPGLNMASGGVSVNLGIEYSLNLIESKTAARQAAFKAAGVTSQSVRPVLTFNYRLH
ncbi:MAG: hypothetical protein EBR09_05375 [Proteobacteria bacterium]|nr:hypothetical protein [Pseudomonadota bacterium]